ncbi:hypothetical protein VNI00_005301 [Paramarasmius palmivorus]|uniref:Thioredoxin domain-containing protein n=1 Tax=Paramarasmius palmivorus TaxID=297713 RepID=A0AAW0DGE2_9AGAR
MKYFTLSLLSFVTIALSLKLSSEAFEPTISEGVWVVNFESPYCSHCKHFKPLWNELVEEKLGSPNPGIRFAEVNCVTDGDLCNANKVTGYPQMNVYHDGQFMAQYQGRREAHLLREFFDLYSEPEVETSPTIAQWRSSKLSSGNYSSTISEGVWMVYHETLNCGPICEAFRPLWDEFSWTYARDIHFADIDCLKYGDVCDAHGISRGAPQVNFYQTGKLLGTYVYHGEEIEEARNTLQRDVDALERLVTHGAGLGLALSGDQQSDVEGQVVLNH